MQQRAIKPACTRSLQNSLTPAAPSTDARGAGGAQRGAVRRVDTPPDGKRHVAWVATGETRLHRTRWDCVSAGGWAARAGSTRGHADGLQHTSDGVFHSGETLAFTCTRKQREVEATRVAATHRYCGVVRVLPSQCVPRGAFLSDLDDGKHCRFSLGVDLREYLCLLLLGDMLTSCHALFCSLHSSNSPVL